MGSCGWIRFRRFGRCWIRLNTGDAIRDRCGLAMTTQSAETSNAAKVRMGGWYDMARSGGVKFIALGVSAVLGILITRIIITNFGTDVFAQYGLLVGLVRCFPSVCWALMRRSSTVLPSPMTSARMPACAKSSSARCVFFWWQAPFCSSLCY